MEATFSGPDDVEGEAPDDGHVGGAMAVPQAGLIFLEDGIEDPTKALDAPVTADGLGGPVRRQRGGGDEGAGLTADRAAAFDLGEVIQH